jgi:hypothetical protein
VGEGKNRRSEDVRKEERKKRGLSYDFNSVSGLFTNVPVPKFKTQLLKIAENVILEFPKNYSPQ